TSPRVRLQTRSKKVVVEHQIGIRVGVLMVRSRQKTSGKKVAKTRTEFELAVEAVGSLRIVLLANVGTGQPFGIPRHDGTVSVVERVCGTRQPPVAIGYSHRPVSVERKPNPRACLLEILPADLVG